MKRIGIFLLVVMLGLSLLVPSITSAANITSGSTANQQVTRIILQAAGMLQ